MVNICNDLKELRVKLNGNKDTTLIIDLSNDNFLSVTKKIREVIEYGIDTISCISCIRIVA